MTCSNILIPTDGSAGAAHASEHGLSLAAALDATVHVRSVVDETSLGLDVRSTISGREREQAATDAVDDLVSGQGHTAFRIVSGTSNTGSRSS